jgi:hypothetical protein
MASEQYMSGRRQYKRPQALLLANNPGYLSNGARIPEGTEFEDFIILSDHNRLPIKIGSERIERKERMINGRMRSYHIADKSTIQAEWTLLPSRAFSVIPEFSNAGANAGKITNLVTSVNSDGTVRPVKSSGSPFFKDQQYTTDGGAGGAELLKWYEENKGSFWIYLSYDNYVNLNNEMDRLKEYSEVIEVFFGSFEHSIEKRGGDNHDLWTVSMTLEEV